MLTYLGTLNLNIHWRSMTKWVIRRLHNHSWSGVIAGSSANLVDSIKRSASRFYSLIADLGRRFIQFLESDGGADNQG